MKFISRILFLLPLVLSGCNLVAFMDKPSGDFQLLDAARSCLDRGDFTCAKDYYQQLSNSFLDIKISESDLTTLGENNIFFLSDLISSLGSNTGNGNSLARLAEILASRGKFDSSTRSLIQSLYAREVSISDPTLEAYSQLISSISMFSSVLASAVGADGVLTANDLVNDPSVCRAAGAGCVAASQCDKPPASGLEDKDATEASGLATASGWSTSNSVEKIKFAAAAADTAISTLTGSSGTGLLGALDSLGNIPGAGTAAQARCSRQALLITLFP